MFTRDGLTGFVFGAIIGGYVIESIRWIAEMHGDNTAAKARIRKLENTVADQEKIIEKQRKKFWKKTEG